MEESKTPPIEDAICDLIMENYSPGTKEDFEVSMNTNQVFQQLQEIYPSEKYTSEEVYNTLKSLNYIIDNIGGCWEWLLKRK